MVWRFSVRHFRNGFCATYEATRRANTFSGCAFSFLISSATAVPVLILPIPHSYSDIPRAAIFSPLVQPVPPLVYRMVYVMSSDPAGESGATGGAGALARNRRCGAGECAASRPLARRNRPVAPRECAASTILRRATKRRATVPCSAS